MLARMLRPVPSRPPGPVDPTEAARHVSTRLPALDAPAVAALVDRGPGRAATALRREHSRASRARGSPPPWPARARSCDAPCSPCPGSGWCERAERLLSDRIDDALDERGHARLDVHMANCERCVEHEIRLGQAQNALANGFLAERPPAEPSVPAAQLRVVEAETGAEEAAQAEAPGFLGGVAVVAPLALTALLTAIIALAMLFAGAL